MYKIQPKFKGSPKNIRGSPSPRQEFKTVSTSICFLTQNLWWPNKQDIFDQKSGHLQLRLWQHWIFGRVVGTCPSVSGGNNWYFWQEDGTEGESVWGNKTRRYQWKPRTISSHDCADQNKSLRPKHDISPNPNQVVYIFISHNYTMNEASSNHTIKNRTTKVAKLCHVEFLQFLWKPMLPTFIMLTGLCRLAVWLFEILKILRSLWFDRTGQGLKYTTTVFVHKISIIFHIHRNKCVPLKCREVWRRK